MRPDDVRLLLDYHVRSTDRILGLCGNLTDEDLRAPAGFDHGTAFQTLRHLVDVDWSWREFCTGNDVGKTYAWDVYPLEDLEQIERFWAQERDRLTRYVASLDQEALDEPLTIGSSEPVTVARAMILAHVVNHGTQHRTELARYLTDHGHSPGDLDLI